MAVNGRSIVGTLMTLIESESYLFDKEVLCLNELLSYTVRGMFLMNDHFVGRSWPFELTEIDS